VTHNALLTHQQRLWVVVLSGPPGSLLGGTTALELDGMGGLTDRRIHLVVPSGQRRPAPHHGVVAHWSTRLDEHDVNSRGVPRRTLPARSIVDGASWAHGDAAARVLILAGVQHRLATPGQLRDALGRRGPCRRHAIILESITDAEGGVESLPEREFATLLVRHRLPRPTRQQVCHRPDGRYYLDADWPHYGVTAEIEGRHHFEVLNWDADLDRHNAITAQGRRVLHFTSYTVRHRPGRVVELLAEAFRRSSPGLRPEPARPS
jgi:very-short-patch-repair endonuclease